MKTSRMFLKETTLCLLLLAGVLPARAEKMTLAEARARIPQREIPDFWIGDYQSLSGRWDHLKLGRARIIATSPGGRPIHLISYGDLEPLPQHANFNSAIGAKQPSAYRDKADRNRPVLLLLGPVHGQEVEGLTGLANLVEIMENGRDLRGKAQPEIRALGQRCRLLIIPTGNPDGLARFEPRTFLNMEADDIRFWGQGTWSDGTLCRWPDVKRLHPMVGTNVGFLGCYFDEHGVNPMHDEFFSPMSTEAPAILRVAREEAPDWAVSLHSAAYNPEPVRPAYLPIEAQEQVRQMTERFYDRLEASGLPHGKLFKSGPEEGQPPPSFNLVSAIYHVSGAAAFTLECPCGIKGEGYCHINLDQILDVQLALYASMMETALAAKPAANASAVDEAAAQHAAIGIKTTRDNFQRTTHPDAQWFGEAGLGLFIHWGLGCVHGGLDLSWGMMAGKPWLTNEKRGANLISPDEYFDLARRFKPEKFDPNGFLRVARQAGFRYAVMTAKHHEGFAMWPSDAGDFGVKQYLPGEDFVKKYVEACRANGLKVGLYYSPPDWHFNRDYMSFNYGSQDQKRFPGRPHFNTRFETVESIPKPSEAHQTAFHDYLRRQITELLTRYGKIDLIWFDGGPEVMSIDEIRALQPGIVINPRMHGYGDFATPEGRMPDGPIKGWWELCDTWAGGWGYNHSHEKYLSTAWMLERLTRVRGWGGNYLINVGPRADGTLPDTCYQRMKELTGWMEIHAGSVFDVVPGPFPDRCNVPVTVKDHTWFAHLAPTFKKPVVITGVQAPERVSLLGAKNSLESNYQQGTLTINVPVEQRSELVDVIRIQWP